MNSRALTTTAAFAALSVLVAVPAQAQNRWYLGAEFGGGLAPSVTMDGASNDRVSRCDEFINPNYANIPDCTGPNRGSQTGWKAKFASAAGLLGNLTLGYQMKDWLRVELEHAVWTATYDDAVPVGSAVGDNLAKLNQEISIAREHLGTFVSSAVNLNVYYDHHLAIRPLTLYAGAGMGIAFTTAGYTSLWSREKDPNKIETGMNEPNAEEIRNNLAGTFSHGQIGLRSTTPIVHAMVGVDRHLSDKLSLGFKARYAVHLDFDSDDLVWDPLRSHVPNIRKDLSEPVRGFMTTGDFTAISVGLHVKHRF